jgi:hypothetical protein
MTWNRKAGSKRQQGIGTPKQPTSRRALAAAKRIAEKTEARRQLDEARRKLEVDND